MGHRSRRDHRRACRRRIGATCRRCVTVDARHRLRPRLPDVARGRGDRRAASTERGNAGRFALTRSSRAPRRAGDVGGRCPERCSPPRRQRSDHRRLADGAPAPGDARKRPPTLPGRPDPGRRRHRRRAVDAAGRAQVGDRRPARRATPPAGRAQCARCSADSRPGLRDSPTGRAAQTVGTHRRRHVGHRRSHVHRRTSSWYRHRQLHRPGARRRRPERGDHHVRTRRCHW